MEYAIQSIPGANRGLGVGLSGHPKDASRRLGSSTMTAIDDLLNRRSDLSTFVVHLTKGEGGEAKQNLMSILTGSVIRARTPMGWMGGLPDTAKTHMKVVCFSETPLEHIYGLFAEIPGRQVQLRGYGLAFTKATARHNGANPIWYVDMSPERRGTWKIAKALDGLRDIARDWPAGFAAHPASKILPFIEPMGSWPGGSRKEFWWEREWRHLGSFVFLPEDVALVLCPQEEIDEFEALGPFRAVDPSWSLERMIAKLARLSTDRAGPV
jgi:hypothetical protein